LGIPKDKRAFGAFDAFLNDLNNHVFFGLDYYDPGMKGPSGKPKSVLGWMRESARRFCANTNTSLLHQEKLAKQTDFSRSGVRSALAAEELPAGIKWIPCFTKTFLKTLGLDIGIVAKLGYADVERLILGIVESPATGLSEEQVWLAKQKLAGQSNEEIGKALGGITKEAVRQKLGLVVQRMKLHLPRINP